MKNLFFIIGRVRSKEGELINAQEWQRLTEASELSAWLELLKATVYGPYLEKITNFEEFETGLNQYFQALKQDLFAIQQVPFGALLWKKYDYHNIKILLKMKHGHKNLKKYLLPFGEINLNILEAYILGNEKVELSLHWKQIIRQAQEIYEQSGSFAELNNFLDKVYFREINELITIWPESVQDHYRRLIDSANFKLWWFRHKQPEIKVDYLPGGKILPRGWQLFDTLGSVTQKFFPGINLEENSAEAAIQKSIDDNIARLLFQQRFRNISIIPIIVFFLAKELEIKNLKTLYLKQAKQLDSLKDYLRESYV